MTSDSVHPTQFISIRKKEAFFFSLSLVALFIRRGEDGFNRHDLPSLGTIALQFCKAKAWTGRCTLQVKARWLSTRPVRSVSARTHFIQTRWITTEGEQPRGFPVERMTGGGLPLGHVPGGHCTRPLKGSLDTLSFDAS